MRRPTPGALLALALLLATAGLEAQAGGSAAGGAGKTSAGDASAEEPSAGEPSAGEPTAEPATTRRGAATSGGSFYVEWWPEPAPLPLNEMFEIRFRVLAAEDRETLVEGAAITAQAWMPEHNHGTPLEPRIEAHGDGTFTGRGFLLQMEGHWELRVGVAADGRMERAVFEIELEP